MERTKEKKFGGVHGIRLTIALMVMIGIAVSAALFPLLGRGAADAEMLAVFEVDEYAQYPHVLRMVTPGATALETVRNFLIYLHYFYGYPFYALSGAVLLAAKPFIADFPNATRIIVSLLRLGVSVIPMILALAILTGLTTRFRSRFRSIALFLFLLSVPAVLTNHFWWHPDSLSFLFVVGVIWFLDRDAGRIGRFYYGAAAMTGVAIGTKYQGIYFALTIPLLLFQAVRSGQLPVRKALLHALGFVIVMALFVVIANPLLLLPQERAEIFRIQSQLFNETGVGMLTLNDASVFDGLNLNDALRSAYGEVWFILLGGGGWILAFSGRDERLKRLALIVLSYSLVAFAVLTLSPTNRSHYFLALFLPLMAGWAFLLPERIADLFGSDSSANRGIKWVASIFAALWLVQFCANLVGDAALVREQADREINSAKIRFMAEIDPDVERALAQVQRENRMLRVLRDSKVYFPERDGVNIRQDWDMLTDADVEEYRPDWILVETENLARLGDRDILDEAIDFEKMTQIVDFYEAVRGDQLPNYRVFRRNEAVVLLTKTNEN